VSSDTIGLKWGFALSVIIGIPLIAGVFAYGALHECAGAVDCQQGASWRLFAAAALIAIGIGFGTRLLVNITFRRLRALAEEQEREG
jgi:hypothetical protein